MQDKWRTSKQRSDYFYPSIHFLHPLIWCGVKPGVRGPAFRAKHCFRRHYHRVKGELVQDKWPKPVLPLSHCHTCWKYNKQPFSHIPVFPQQGLHGGSLGMWVWNLLEPNHGRAPAQVSRSERRPFVKSGHSRSRINKPQFLCQGCDNIHLTEWLKFLPCVSVRRIFMVSSGWTVRTFPAAPSFGQRFGLSKINDQISAKIITFGINYWHTSTLHDLKMSITAYSVKTGATNSYLHTLRRKTWSQKKIPVPTYYNPVFSSWWL